MIWLLSVEVPEDWQPPRWRLCHFLFLSKKKYFFEGYVKLLSLWRRRQRLWVGPWLCAISSNLLPWVRPGVWEALASMLDAYLKNWCIKLQFTPKIIMIPRVSVGTFTLPMVNIILKRNLNFIRIIIYYILLSQDITRGKLWLKTCKIT